MSSALELQLKHGSSSSAAPKHYSSHALKSYATHYISPSSPRHSARVIPLKPSSRRTHSYPGTNTNYSRHLPLDDASVPEKEMAKSALGHRRAHSLSHNLANLSPFSTVEAGPSNPLKSPPRVRFAEPVAVVQEAEKSTALTIASGAEKPSSSLTSSTSSTINSLLTYTGFHRTVSYNLVFPPIHNFHMTIMHPISRKAFPPRILNEPATSPPVEQLTITSPHLPWSIIVTSQVKARNIVTNLDVFQALHDALNVPVTRREWDGLGEDSRMLERAARSYHIRCTLLGNDWEGGVRRVDWLGSNTMFVGLEAKADGAYELVLGS